MAIRQSAGIVMYRWRESVLEVFLVHPGGPFWAKKDAGAWSVPKGEFEGDEDPLAAARREFREETGFDAVGTFVALAPVKQVGGKRVLAWAVKGDCDPAQIRSNLFTLEWPPRSGKHRQFPEIDRAGWFSLDLAREKILKSQLGLLEQLEEKTTPPARQ